jgi:hypothetical protein
MHRLSALGIVIVAAAACGKHQNGNGGGTDAPNATADAPLTDNGPCMPEALRCNGNTIEQCNANGTNWVPQQACQFGCLDGQCALNGLDVPSDTQMDGIVVVKGVVHVHDGATLSSPSGNLTIIADEIDVDMGGSIAVAPTGTTAQGQGTNGITNSSSEYDGIGGGYGTFGNGWTSSSQWGSTSDSDVQPGSPGGKPAPFVGNSTVNAQGGGVLRLLATKITIAGTLAANGSPGPLGTNCDGGGGGGSGGGILVSGDNVTVSGSITAAGGVGGHQSNCSGFANDGGQGRVKILFGTAHAVTGSIIGVQSTGLAPPYPIASDTHSDTTQTYNDNFTALDASWPKPFGTVMGYYVKVDTTQTTIPSPANAMFVAAAPTGMPQGTSFMANALMPGTNYVHVVSIDAMSNVGTIQTTFPVKINTSAPSVSSSSHPSSTMFSTNVNPFFQWSYPQGDAMVSNAYYVFDNFGLTIPTTSDGKLPATQKQLLQSNVANGVWVLHVVAADSAGRLTKLAGHYRVSIGPDPGNGGVNGHVVNGAQPVAGATVTVNRGLYSATTDASGNYSITGVTAGTWEISVTTSTMQHAAKTATIPAGTSTTVDLTL